MVRRALVLFGAGYGNVVMATPVVRALVRLGWRTSALMRGTWPDCGVLLAGWSEIERVYAGELPPGAGRFDLVVRTVWANFPPLGAGPELHPPELDLTRVHEADANLLALRNLGWNGAERPAPYCYRGTAPARDLAARVVLVPSAGVNEFWTRKAWIPWRWMELEHAVEQQGHRVLLVGSAHDHATLAAALGREKIPGLWGAPLAEVLGVIAQARAVASPDCGVAHMAAALGVPTVALFGPTSETKSRPLGPRVRVVTREKLSCRPCQGTPRWAACRDWRCMDIPAAVVTDALEEVLR